MPGTIFAVGSLNTTALTVPGLYIGIQAPQNLFLRGVPTNILGVIGTATWGPVNKASIIAGANYSLTFGAVQNRKYDMGTHVAIGTLQGAANFRCVRVTDGTDTASAATVVTGATITALYTGTNGNNVTLTLTQGSKAGTLKAVVILAPQSPEVYDNLPGASVPWAATTAYLVGATVTNGTNVYRCTVAGTSASSGGPTGTSGSITDGGVTWVFVNAVSVFWTNLNAAINTGAGVLRGPSQTISMSLSSPAALPALGTAIPLTGGTDGVATLTAAVLIGQDVLPRKGMYALRQQGASVVVLADADDPTQWTTQAAFGLSTGAYMICVGPAGDTISNAAAVKALSGADTYACKIMFGDWCYWNDQTNNVLRLVSPAAFVAGLLANLSPEQSTLNKPLFGIVGTQKSGVPGSTQVNSYAGADLAALFAAQIDVIGNPSPGGNYWAVQGGFNASSNPAVNGDNYTRMTNYIASTLAAGMGLYVGQTIVGTSFFRNIRTTLLTFCSGLQAAKMLPSYGTALPYAVQCDDPTVAGTNNPGPQVALGNVQATVQVQYAPINQFFVVNVEGGQTVTVTTSPANSNAPLSAAA